MMKKIYTLAAMLLGLMGLLSACISAEDTEIALSDQDPDNLVYNCDRQTVVLRIDCNRSWKASTSEDWIEIKEASGKAGSSQKLAMTLSSNTTTAYRSAEITIAAGKKTLVLTLTQAPEIIYFVNEKFEEVTRIKQQYVSDVTYKNGILTVVENDEPLNTELSGVAFGATYDKIGQILRIPMFGRDTLEVNFTQLSTIKSGSYNSETGDIDLVLANDEVV